MNIGQRMRDRRIELNINPKDIAKKIGKSVSTYYRYETGEIEKLTISKMCEIAEFLKVSPIYLLLGNNSENDTTTEKAPATYQFPNYSTAKYKASQSYASYPSEEYSTQKTKELLLSLDMSIEEFSSLTNISVEQLEIYKKGQCLVDHNHIISISNALDIPPSDILFKRDDSALLKKISKLNAMEIKEVERFIDSMENNKRNNKKSTY